MKTTKKTSDLPVIADDDFMRFDWATRWIAFGLGRIAGLIFLCAIAGYIWGKL